MTIRQVIHFDDDVLNRLKDYCKKRYGNRRSLSAVTQHAIVKFLDGEGVDGKTTKRRKPKTF